jgi:hypothetical protein
MVTMDSIFEKTERKPTGEAGAILVLRGTIAPGSPVCLRCRIAFETVDSSGQE